MNIKDLFSLKALINAKNKRENKRLNEEKRKLHEKELQILSERLGVDFGGYIPDTESLGTNSAYCNGYEASYPMPEIFRMLDIKQGDRLLDIGSGKGYAMYLFSQFPFSKIHGVELSEELFKISKANLEKIFPDDDRFQVFCGDALELDCLDDYNYIFMYNPFPREIIPTFVDRLKKSLINNPRKLVVVYQNPQRGALFEESGVFKTLMLKDGTAVFESID